MVKCVVIIVTLVIQIMPGAGQYIIRYMDGVTALLQVIIFYITRQGDTKVSGHPFLAINTVH